MRNRRSDKNYNFSETKMLWWIPLLAMPPTPPLPRMLLLCSPPAATDLLCPPPTAADAHDAHSLPPRRLMLLCPPTDAHLLRRIRPPPHPPAPASDRPCLHARRLPGPWRRPPADAHLMGNSQTLLKHVSGRRQAAPVIAPPVPLAVRQLRASIAPNCGNVLERSEPIHGRRPEIELLLRWCSCSCSPADAPLASSLLPARPLMPARLLMLAGAHSPLTR